MNTKNTKRSPVVAVMGHVDHGKSTLLDYIRKTNIVDGEAGGITQHLSTYEVKLSSGNISFIDTPGHAAFNEMRHRGASVADIAILIVSAEDSVKQQTKHAIEVIKKNDIPFMVAINKVDKPQANPDKVKSDLLEEGIYVEGYGGDVPVVEISATVGTGVDDLLETLVLIADIQEMTGNPELLATGFVIEAHRDPQQGISATLIIKDGSIEKGQYVVVDDTITPTRILRDFMGNDIDEAQFSSPITLVGFNDLPPIGSTFATYETKKDAQQAIAEFNEIKHELEDRADLLQVPEGVALIPIILKTDVQGTNEAITNAIEELSDDEVIFKIIKNESGDINESDIKLASTDENTVVLGFHVQEDPAIKNLNEYEMVDISTYTIIYELTEYLNELRSQRRIKKEVDTELGQAKILATFSRQKDRAVIGGKVTSDRIAVGDDVKIVRNKTEIVGQGTITGLQQGKVDTSEVKEGNECGIMCTSKEAIEKGDVIISFIRELK